MNEKKKSKSQKRREQRKRKANEVTLEVQSVSVKPTYKPAAPVKLDLGDKNG